MVQQIKVAAFFPLCSRHVPGKDTLNCLYVDLVEEHTVAVYFKARSWEISDFCPATFRTHIPRSSLSYYIFPSGYRTQMRVVFKKLLRQWFPGFGNAVEVSRSSALSRTVGNCDCYRLLVVPPLYSSLDRLSVFQPIIVCSV